MAAEDAWILGIHMTRFGAHPAADLVDLASEAVTGALADADVTMADLGALAVGNVMARGSTFGQRIQKQVGQTGIPVYNVANTGATGATALRTAVLAVKAGECDLGLAVGVDQVVGDFSPSSLSSAESLDQLADELADLHTGTPLDVLARISAKNHRHASRNPLAADRRAWDEAAILAAPTVVGPLTRPMCALACDGAAAVVVASGARLRALSTGQRRRAVKISASVMTSDPAPPGVRSASRAAATLAYEQAGLGPADLDLVELHDGVATAELAHYDDLLLCEPGGAVDFFESGAPRHDGRLPVNLSGGHQGRGDAVSATGIAGPWELCRHLRGEGGPRQVEGARVALAHAVGVGATCVVHVLERSG